MSHTLLRDIVPEKITEISNVLQAVEAAHRIG
jgi:hypothetical protein